MDEIDINIKAKYRHFASQYARDTMHLSFVKANHPAYQELLAMGQDIVPLLLRDVATEERRPIRDVGFWASVSLLCQITGAAPWKPEDAGRLRPIRDAWVRWGQEKGYLPKPPADPAKLRFYNLFRALWKHFFS
jgi:hypothetical protein